MITKPDDKYTNLGDLYAGYSHRNRPYQVKEQMTYEN
jgi:hypothetical protein